MFKKLLKIIGSFFLVLFIIAVCFAIWASFSASKYTESAQPYLTKNLPAVVSWDFEKFKPLLTPEALKEFETERGQKIYKYFSKLGPLKSLEESKFIRAAAGINPANKKFEIVSFATLGHFETGDAHITTTLAVSGDSYLIQHINVNSDVFLD